MRALLQRVRAAAVSVQGHAHSDAAATTRRIERGLVVFLGVTNDDTEKDASWLAEKIPALRLFPGEGDSEFDRSVTDIGGEILVVSQFTLFADARKGRRPDFSRAARPEAAKALYDRFLALLGGKSLQVATGEFGAAMQVEIHNDGPVTILLDSRNEKA